MRGSSWQAAQVFPDDFGWSQGHWLSSSPREKLPGQVLGGQPGSQSRLGLECARVRKLSVARQRPRSVQTPMPAQALASGSSFFFLSPFFSGDNAFFSRSVCWVFSDQVCRLHGFGSFHFPPPLTPPISPFTLEYGKLNFFVHSKICRGHQLSSKNDSGHGEYSRE